MSASSEIKEKIDTKTLNLVLLSLVTGHIYSLLWLYRSTEIISDTTKSQLVSHAYIVWIAICLCLSFTLGSSYSGSEEAEKAMSLLLGVPVKVLYTIWAFKARKALSEYAIAEHKFPLKMNVFYTLLFDVFYINYCVNTFEEEKIKNQIKNDNSPI